MGSSAAAGAPPSIATSLATVCGGKLVSKLFWSPFWSPFTRGVAEARSPLERLMGMSVCCTPWLRKPPRALSKELDMATSGAMTAGMPPTERSASTSEVRDEEEAADGLPALRLGAQSELAATAPLGSTSPCEPPAWLSKSMAVWPFSASPLPSSEL